MKYLIILSAVLESIKIVQSCGTWDTGLAWPDVNGYNGTATWGRSLFTMTSFVRLLKQLQNKAFLISCEYAVNVAEFRRAQSRSQSLWSSCSWDSLGTVHYRSRIRTWKMWKKGICAWRSCDGLNSIQCLFDEFKSFVPYPGTGYFKSGNVQYVWCITLYYKMSTPWIIISVIIHV